MRVVVMIVIDFTMCRKVCSAVTLIVASQRQYDVLLFWALDRLSREGALKTLTYLQQLTAYGCKWRSFTEPYIDSCGLFADAIVGFLACIARQERARISERTLQGL